jgi:hypothetical protein
VDDQAPGGQLNLEAERVGGKGGAGQERGRRGESAGQSEEQVAKPIFDHFKTLESARLAARLSLPRST